MTIESPSSFKSLPPESEKKRPLLSFNLATWEVTWEGKVIPINGQIMRGAFAILLVSKTLDPTNPLTEAISKIAQEARQEYEHHWDPLMTAIKRLRRNLGDRGPSKRSISHPNSYFSAKNL